MLEQNHQMFNGDASKTFYSTFYNRQIYNWINIKVTKSQLVNLKICFECKKILLAFIASNESQVILAQKVFQE